jgi:hypothetical protein
MTIVARRTLKIYRQNILAPSFKVAVSLTEDEALALASELLSVVASRRGSQSSRSNEELD